MTPSSKQKVVEKSKCFDRRFGGNKNAHFISDNYLHEMMRYGRKLVEFLKEVTFETIKN